MNELNDWNDDELTTFFCERDDEACVIFNIYLLFISKVFDVNCRNLATICHLLNAFMLKYYSVGTRKFCWSFRLPFNSLNLSAHISVYHDKSSLFQYYSTYYII